MDHLTSCHRTKEQAEIGRRLIRFYREHKGEEVRVSFQGIAQDDWKDGEGMICVSCIYSHSTDKCYITSVDAIRLLEALVGQDFPVDEKNRIRRNFEHFKPQTLSKHRPDTSYFFKKIMAFPEPQPRTIGKDIKVFEWDHLEAMLRKIIAKYVSCRTSLSGMKLMLLFAFRRHTSPMTEVPVPPLRRLPQNQNRLLSRRLLPCPS